MPCTSKRPDLFNDNQSFETAANHLLFKYDIDDKSAHLITVFSCSKFKQWILN